MKRKTLLGCFALLAVWALTAQEVSQSGLELKAPRAMVNQPERARHAMVATVHELATRVGLEVLRKGGNAVDAAVAVAFALAVVHPEAGNLGGGGYMLVRMADGRTAAIDYRERAPQKAKHELFKDPSEYRVGYKSVAVPGTVAGMGMAHKMFGSRPWKEVLEPSRRLAAKGFPASYRMELILGLQVPVMSKFPETAKVFLHGKNQPLKQGELVLQPDLAKTIGRLQKQGWREFYEGETARRIAEDMRANGGFITLEDLKNYKAILREPLKGSYRGVPLLTMPPSTSGGIAVLQILNILERFPIKLGMEGSSEVRHLQIEAMRRAYRDRLRYAGDPDHVEIPVAKIISKSYAKALAASINPQRATPSKALGAELSARWMEEQGEQESADTTHFSIIDAAGNVVTNTYTLNGFFGSQVIAKGTGVLLNDIMSAFSTREGSPNYMAGGKRPVSSMTPIIALDKSGKPWLALGSPGALTIANTVSQVLVNLIDFRMSLRDAIEWPRIHHQYLPDRVDMEPGAIVFDVAQKLESMGHVLSEKLRSQGDVHAIMVEPQTGWRLGWSDGRRGGRALGY